MKNKRIVTFQDISCVGQCSLSVAMPIISACGHETCPLPSAVLSTHTGSCFSGYTFRDLSEDIIPIAKHWEKEGLYFDIFYSGYLGSISQIEDAEYLMKNLVADTGICIVDPAMADNGVLYGAFDFAYAKRMALLCAKADIVLPNITEACIMCGMEYRTEYDETYIDDLFRALEGIGINSVVLTGVTFSDDKLGVAVRQNGKTEYYFHERLRLSCHGTGDVYASAFTGALANGISLYDSAKIAADYTVRSMLATDDLAEHRYGVRFEKVIPTLIADIQAYKTK